MKDERDEYACPACGTTIRPHKEAEEVSCLGCGTKYATAYGVPNFSCFPDYYWGEIPRDKMKELIGFGSLSDQRLQEWLSTEVPPSLGGYLRQYVLDPTRAGWKYVTALPPAGNALDFGCGWGGISLSLAASGMTVFASDIVPERVGVTLRRAEAQGLENVHGCVSSGWPRIPFAAATFDLVVVNGVLEWLPSGVPGNPKTVQQEFLKEVYRVLKPGGQLYLAIENRYGFHYWRGCREEHTKLKFIALMPRGMARCYHWLMTRRPFRTYTYGKGQLKRLLHASGFSRAKVYWPYPDYREFDRLVDVDDRQWLQASFPARSWLGKIARGVIATFPWACNFAPSLGVVADKSDVQGAWVTRFLKMISEEHGFAKSFSILQYKVSRTGCAQLVVRGEGTHIVTLPMTLRAAQRVSRAICKRKELGALELSEEVAPSIRDFSSGVFERQIYMLESLCQGSPASSMAGGGSGFYREALRWLAAFQKTGLERGRFVLDEEAYPGIEGIRNMMMASWSDKLRCDIGSLMAACEKQPVCTAPIHGDYHAGNILIGGAGAIERVIDWDLASVKGLPMWDVLGLVVHGYYERLGGCWASAYQRAALECAGFVKADCELADYVRQLGLGENDIRYGVATYPLVQLYQKMKYGDGRKEVILEGLESAYAVWFGMMR